MNLLIATHNQKKQAEMQRILSPLGFDVLTAEQAGAEVAIIETMSDLYEVMWNLNPLKAKDAKENPDGDYMASWTSDATWTIVTVPVQISINGTTEAGAVGEYMVYVNISEDTGEEEET
mgnify:CR=1 FL=1